MEHDVLTASASFTDETTPHTMFTGGHRVVVAATIPHDDPLGWLFDLTAAMSSASGEVKSEAALAKLRDLPGAQRHSILAGMRSARIHVCDQRPYRDKIEVDLISLYGDRMAFKSLLAASKSDPLAHRLVELFNEAVARQILIDSPVTTVSYRVQTMVEELGGFASLRRDVGTLDQLIAGLSDPQGGRLLRRAIEFAAKASAAFSEIDVATSDIDSFTSRWCSVSPKVRESVRMMLSQAHVFDRGNDRVVGVLETIRSNMAELLADESVVGSDSGRLITIDSIVSPHVQAADIAAGYAKGIYERDGLVDLTRQFDAVVFNGMRVGESEAERVMKRWNSIRPAA